MVTAKKKGLGRGLEALLGGPAEIVETAKQEGAPTAIARSGDRGDDMIKLRPFGGKALKWASYHHIFAYLELAAASTPVDVVGVACVTPHYFEPQLLALRRELGAAGRAGMGMGVGGWGLKSCDV